MKLFTMAGRIFLLFVALIGLAFFGLISPILKIGK